MAGVGDAVVHDSVVAVDVVGHADDRNPPRGLLAPLEWRGPRTSRQGRCCVLQVRSRVRAFAAAVRRRTSTIPIVFTNVTDPIGQGFVQSLAHPGGRTIQFCLNDFVATL